MKSRRPDRDDHHLLEGVRPADKPAVPVGWWYLSFADESGFLGAAVVEGKDIIDACRRAHELEANPGGEVLGLHLSQEEVDIVEASLRDRLLSVDDLRDAGLKPEAPKLSRHMGLRKGGGGRCG